MGAGNVVQVLTNWSSRLNDRPFRALVQMAVVSKDEDCPPRYWGGWAKIADACGSPVPSGCVTGCRGCEKCASQRRVASRAISALIEAGAVVQIEKAGPRRQACFELHLHDTSGASELHRYGRAKGLPKKSRRTLSVQQTQDADSPATLDAQSLATLDAQSPDEEEYISSTGTQAGNNSSQVTTSPAPVDDAPPAAPTDPAELIPCPRCGWQTWECQSRGTCKPARAKEHAR